MTDRRTKTKTPAKLPLIETDLDLAIRRLTRRLGELDDIISSFSDPADVRVDNAERNIVADIREIFGADSIEFRDNEHYQIWKGPQIIGMSARERFAGVRGGLDSAKIMVTSLLTRLKDREAERVAFPDASAKEAFERLHLHSRILVACSDQFRNGHYRDAVLNASIALGNYVKEKSGRYDLDGTALMNTVFSVKNPVLAFNNLADKSDEDEQQGLMHLFVGAVLALRNPRAHTLRPDSGEDGAQAIALLSFLATRLDGARKVPSKT